MPAYETRVHLVNNDKHGLMIARAEYRKSRGNLRNISEVLRHAEVRYLRDRLEELENRMQRK